MTWRRNNRAVPPPTFFLRLDSSFLLRAMFPRNFLVFELKATFSPGPPLEFVSKLAGVASFFFGRTCCLYWDMAMPKIHQRFKISQSSQKDKVR